VPRRGPPAPRTAPDAFRFDDHTVDVVGQVLSKCRTRRSTMDLAAQVLPPASEPHWSLVSPESMNLSANEESWSTSPWFMAVHSARGSRRAVHRDLLSEVERENQSTSPLVKLGMERKWSAHGLSAIKFHRNGDDEALPGADTPFTSAWQTRTEVRRCMKSPRRGHAGYFVERKEGEIALGRPCV